MCIHSWWIGIPLALLGFSLARRMMWRRWHRGGGGGGRGRMWRIWNDLDLDFQQRRAIRKEMHQLKGAAWQFAGARFDAFDAVVESVAGDDFDRAPLDAFADTQLAHLDALRAQVTHALERIHELLRPEQREKLRAIFAGAPTPSPAASPYR